MSIAITHTFYPRTPSAWRAWLRKNHTRKKEVWVVFYKKHTGRKALAYVDAVEEALCYGWIDGQLRRIDDEKHMLRFSPRRPGSVWAPSNIKRVRKLIRERRMTAAGLKLFRAAKLETRTALTVKTVMKKYKRIVVPPDLRRALASKPIALKHFLGYPPSFRLLAIHWVRNAKKLETRQRRIKNVVSNASKYSRPTF